MPLDPVATLADENARLRSQLRDAKAGPQAPSHKPMEPGLLAERCQLHGEDAGREFRQQIANAASEIDHALGALRRNPMKNQAQIVVEGAELARKRAESIAVVIDVRREGLRQRQAAAAERVAIALRPPNPAEAQEIRTLLRSLPENERYDVINRAQGTDDHLSFLFAIAGAPAALSGLSPGKVMEARNVVLGLKDPELLSLPDALAKESALLDKCEEGFNRTIAELVDFDKADALRQLAGDPQ